MVSLDQGPQTPLGWVAKGQRLGGLGVVQRAARVLPGGVSEARATDYDWLIRHQRRLGSSGIVRDVLGVGLGGVSKARPKTPRRFLSHKTILWVYGDYTGIARPSPDESV